MKTLALLALLFCSTSAAAYDPTDPFQYAYMQSAKAQQLYPAITLTKSGWALTDETHSRILGVWTVKDTAYKAWESYARWQTETDPARRAMYQREWESLLKLQDYEDEENV